MLTKVGRTHPRLRYKYPCVCERCDGISFVLFDHLVYGKVFSCGCWGGGRKGGEVRFTGVSEARSSGSLEVISWQEMRKRCLTKSHPKFRLYGARGITICDEWLGMDGFIQFRNDMGPRPPGTTLGRIDNGGPYCKSNCRWETPVQQANNTRWNRVVNISGVVDTVAGHARRLGVKYEPLRKRIDRRMSMARMIELGLVK